MPDGKEIMQLILRPEIDLTEFAIAEKEVQKGIDKLKKRGKDIENLISKVFRQINKLKGEAATKMKDVFEHAPLQIEPLIKSLGNLKKEQQTINAEIDKLEKNEKQLKEVRKVAATQGRAGLVRYQKELIETGKNVNKLTLQTKKMNDAFTQAGHTMQAAFKAGAERFAHKETEIGQTFTGTAGMLDFEGEGKKGLYDYAKSLEVVEQSMKKTLVKIVEIQTGFKKADATIIESADTLLRFRVAWNKTTNAIVTYNRVFREGTKIQQGFQLSSAIEEVNQFGAKFQKLQNAGNAYIGTMQTSTTTTALFSEVVGNAVRGIIKLTGAEGQERESAGKLINVQTANIRSKKQMAVVLNDLAIAVKNETVAFAGNEKQAKSSLIQMLQYAEQKKLLDKDSKNLLAALRAESTSMKQIAGATKEASKASDKYVVDEKEVIDVTNKATSAINKETQAIDRRTKEVREASISAATRRGATGGRGLGDMMAGGGATGGMGGAGAGPTPLDAFRLNIDRVKRELLELQAVARSPQAFDEFRNRINGLRTAFTRLQEDVIEERTEFQRLGNQFILTDNNINSIYDGISRLDRVLEASAKTAADFGTALGGQRSQVQYQRFRAIFSNLEADYKRGKISAKEWYETLDDFAPVIGRSGKLFAQHVKMMERSINAMDRDRKARERLDLKKFQEQLRAVNREWEKTADNKKAISQLKKLAIEYKGNAEWIDKINVNLRRLQTSETRDAFNYIKGTVQEFKLQVKEGTLSLEKMRIELLGLKKFASEKGLSLLRKELLDIDKQIVSRNLKSLKELGTVAKGVIREFADGKIKLKQAKQQLNDLAKTSKKSADRINVLKKAMMGLKKVELDKNLSQLKFQLDNINREFKRTNNLDAYIVALKNLKATAQGLKIPADRFKRLSDVLAQAQSPAMRFQQQLRKIDTQLKVGQINRRQYIAELLRMHDIVRDDTRALNMWAKALKTAKSGMGDMAKHLGILGQALKTARHHAIWMISGELLFPLYNLPREMARIVTELDKSFSRLKAILTLDPDIRSGVRSINKDMAELEKTAFLFAEKFGKDVKEVIDTMFNFSQQYKDTASIILLTNAALEFELKGFGENLIGTTAALQAVLAQWNLAPVEMNRIANQMAYAGGVVKATGEDIAQALKRSGAGFKVAGADIETAMATLALTLEKTGETAQTVGVSWKTLTARLLRPDTVNALKKLGIEVFDKLDDSANNLQLTFLSLIESWDGLTDKSKAALSQQIAGIRQGVRFQAFMNTQIETFKEMTEVLQGSDEALEALTKEMGEVQLDTLERRVKSASAAWQYLVWTITGDAGVKEAIVSVTATFIKFANWIREHSFEIRMATKGLLLFIGVITLVKGALALVAIQTEIMAAASVKAALANAGLITSNLTLQPTLLATAAAAYTTAGAFLAMVLPILAVIAAIAALGIAAKNADKIHDAFSSKSQKNRIKYWEREVRYLETRIKIYRIFNRELAKELETELLYSKAMLKQLIKDKAIMDKADADAKDKKPETIDDIIAALEEKAEAEMAAREEEFEALKQTIKFGKELSETEKLLLNITSALKSVKDELAKVSDAQADYIRNVGFAISDAKEILNRFYGVQVQGSDLQAYISDVEKLFGMIADKNVTIKDSIEENEKAIVAYRSEIAKLKSALAATSDLKEKKKLENSISGIEKSIRTAENATVKLNRELHQIPIELKNLVNEAAETAKKEYGAVYDEITERSNKFYEDDKISGAAWLKAMGAAREAMMKQFPKIAEQFAAGIETDPLAFIDNLQQKVRELGTLSDDSAEHALKMKEATQAVAAAEFIYDEILSKSIENGLKRIQDVDKAIAAFENERTMRETRLKILGAENLLMEDQIADLGKLNIFLDEKIVIYEELGKVEDANIVRAEKLNNELAAQVLLRNRVSEAFKRATIEIDQFYAAQLAVATGEVKASLEYEKRLEKRVLLLKRLRYEIDGLEQQHWFMSPEELENIIKLDPKILELTDALHALGIEIDTTDASFRALEKSSSIALDKLAMLYQAEKDFLVGDEKTAFELNYLLSRREILLGDLIARYRELGEVASGEALQNMIALDPDFNKLLKDINGLNTAIAKMQPAFMAVIKGAEKAGKAFSDNIKTLISDIFEAEKSILESLTDAVKKHAGIIKDAYKDAFSQALIMKLGGGRKQVEEQAQQVYKQVFDLFGIDYQEPAKDATEIWNDVYDSSLKTIRISDPSGTFEKLDKGIAGVGHWLEKLDQKVGKGVTAGKAESIFGDFGTTGGIFDMFSGGAISKIGKKAGKMSKGDIANAAAMLMLVSTDAQIQGGLQSPLGQMLGSMGFAAGSATGGFFGSMFGGLGAFGGPVGAIAFGLAASGLENAFGVGRGEQRREAIQQQQQGRQSQIDDILARFESLGLGTTQEALGIPEFTEMSQRSKFGLSGTSRWLEGEAAVTAALNEHIITLDRMETAIKNFDEAMIAMEQSVAMGAATFNITGAGASGLNWRMAEQGRNKYYFDSGEFGPLGAFAKSIDMLSPTFNQLTSEIVLLEYHLAQLYEAGLEASDVFKDIQTQLVQLKQREYWANIFAPIAEAEFLEQFGVKSDDQIRLVYADAIREAFGVSGEITADVLKLLAQQIAESVSLVSTGQVTGPLAEQTERQRELLEAMIRILETDTGISAYIGEAAGSSSNIGETISGSAQIIQNDITFAVNAENFFSTKTEMLNIAKEMLTMMKQQDWIDPSVLRI